MHARRLVAFCLVFAAAATAQAQTSADGERVQLKRSVKPSYRIEPIVHRFKSRRGEVKPFSFEVNSLGKEIELEVHVVGLRQDESGIILHDSEGAAPTEIEMLTPQKFRLLPGETKFIKGELTTPLAKSNYLSYGVLVRESVAGEQADEQQANPTKTTAGVKFVTQYVLRVDVETGIAGVGDIKQLRLEEGQIVSIDGLPVALAYLNNPTNFSFECFVSSSFQSPGAKSRQQTQLGMPSRSGLEGGAKYLVRVMPNSRIRLSAPIEQVLNLGPQVMTLNLASPRRKIYSSEFDIVVNQEAFPALASRRAVLREGVIMSPSQLELGLTNLTKRTEALEFRNTSDEPMEVSLDPRTLGEDRLTGVRFSPATFTLKPGRTKKVRALFRGSASASAASGLTWVTVAAASGDSVTHKLPLSVLTDEPSPPTLELSPIDWKSINDRNAFVVSVTNRSPEYVPLNAKLAVANKLGSEQLMQAGYGAWLAPGKSTDLVFYPQRKLPTGEYNIGLQIKTREGFDPIVRTLQAELTGSDATANATPPAKSSQAG